MTDVTMPKMGDGMSEGTITSWLKREGDVIKEGDSIAEVETDKANVEIPAEESGVLSRIIVQTGQTVPVGAVIAQIGEPGAAETAGGSEGSRKRPVARETTQQAGGAVSNGGQRSAPPEAPTSTLGKANGELQSRLKVSPLAKRLAGERGVDLAQLRGTGPGGRIVERDVLNANRQATAAQPTAPATPTVQPQASPVAGSTAEIKPSRMREAIARRTVQSKQTIPHFYVTMVVEMDRAQQLLSELNRDSPEGKVTVNHIIIKACALALGRVPEVNSAWTQKGTVQRFAEAHIGMAVGIDEGLVVPVIRNCEGKTLRAIAADARQLVEKARANQLKPEEYSGGTFSTTNLGMMGVDEFIAIINPPEAAILAIGGIERQPVVIGDSEDIEIRSRMKITLSSDHRILDGVISARFLQAVKQALESPYSLIS